MCPEVALRSRGHATKRVTNGGPPGASVGAASRTSRERAEVHVDAPSGAVCGRQCEERAADVTGETATAQRKDIAVKAVVKVVSCDASDDTQPGDPRFGLERAGAEEGDCPLDACPESGRRGPCDRRGGQPTIPIDEERDLRGARRPEGGRLPQGICARSLWKSPREGRREVGCIGDADRAEEPRRSRRDDGAGRRWCVAARSRRGPSAPRRGRRGLDDGFVSAGEGAGSVS